jgi:hypothetical protein
MIHPSTLMAPKETQFPLRWAAACEVSIPRCCRNYPYTHAVAWARWPYSMTTDEPEDGRRNGRGQICTR